jgi:hypothetical protein
MPQTISQRLLPGLPLVESPLFSRSIDDMGLTTVERDIAVQLNERGFAVFDFPDELLNERIDRIIPALTPLYAFDEWREVGWASNNGLRLQDAWVSNEDVRAITCNQAVIDLLSKLYGRRAFPFQSLNFPVGTQQHYHSDSIHFSTAPERFMCGVWLAMEDIHPDAGPLVYYPGSHKWPIIYNDMIGRIGAENRDVLAQEPYELAWEAMVQASGIKPEYFCPKKGQALIWAANLLHGGSRQNDPGRTRWSQVTHYYFDDCTYYTPAFSDPVAGNLDLRDIVDISIGRTKPNLYVGKPIAEVRRLASKRKAAPAKLKKLPPDFNAKRYLELNADLALAKVNPKSHYLRWGHAERRRYR